MTVGAVTEERAEELAERLRWRARRVRRRVGRGESRRRRLRPVPVHRLLTDELAARRREAGARARAHGRARARRARRPRARQRPLPDELLGDEGLRRLRLPARGRAGADLPRGVGGGRRAQRPGRPTCASSRATTSAILGRPTARVLELAREAASGYGRVGLELSLGTQATDRMVGEPTTFTAEWFTAFGDVADATPLLAAARALKTEQEIERMRLANDIAAAAMEHCKLVIEPGMSEAQIAAEWEGFVHGEGTGWEGKVDLALGFSLVWSGPGIKTFTATTSRTGRRGRADPVRDLGLRGRLLVRPHEEPRRRRAHAALPRARGRGSWASTPMRSPPSRRARASRSSTGASARASPAIGFRGPAVASDLPRRRSARARAAVRAPGRRRRDGDRAWFLQSSQDAISKAAGACASRTTSSSPSAGAEKLSPFPDGIVTA